ncbi:hypothetical protein GT972_02610 [Sinimarinibacterium sp. NLF-5-8]|nr:hypothetical protein GT972_02610 [Sinimarinibacterium sp. NLF-5-8]
MRRPTVKRMWCCGCDKPVIARLTDGSEVYPRRPDLADLPFWKCDACQNYVGCHHQTRNRTKPLGAIPSPEIRNARKHIHAILDPMWKSGQWKRKLLYERISFELGYEYHTAHLRSLDEARTVYRIIKRMRQ